MEFRTYRPEPLFGADYKKLRDFLVRLDSHNYPFGRWDWMITHFMLDPDALPKVGLWLEGGEVVAAATVDCHLGAAYLLCLPAHRDLLEDMLAYAQGALHKDGALKVLILDGDGELQRIAAKHGFLPTQDKECDAVYPIGDLADIRYTLPGGFRVTSMAETYDLPKYGEVLWKGFNHEADGQGPFVWKEEERPRWEAVFQRPNVDLHLKIAVVAPDGRFVSYCGMWKDPESDSALVEPVATDPAFRKQGLGRAAVLEGVRRCGALGARRAYVGSSQQFYYAIGFRSWATSTWWAAPPA